MCHIYALAYSELAATKAAFAYCYCICYLLWPCKMWDMPRSYVVTAYFLPNFKFADRFVAITYQLWYLKYDKGLLLHMRWFYIGHSLPWWPRLLKTAVSCHKKLFDTCGPIQWWAGSLTWQEIFLPYQMQALIYMCLICVLYV
jgi:hypothetical protein